MIFGPIMIFQALFFFMLLTKVYLIKSNDDVSSLKKMDINSKKVHHVINK